MKLKIVVGLVATLSISAFAQDAAYNRAAARAAYLESVKASANARTTQQVQDVFSNPTYLPNGAQDNAGMRKKILAIINANDPSYAENRAKATAAALAPYIGKPGRAMNASEIPAFDSYGFYFIPGFGQVQVPLSTEQMDLYNKVRATGYAPQEASKYLMMLGISYLE